MCGITMALSLPQVILASTFILNIACSTPSDFIHFLQVACSDPDIRDSLRGSELNRLADFPRIRCAFCCYQTPGCFFAVDVTIGGQKTCVHIAGKNKTSLFPAYASESDCTVLITDAHDISCPAGLIGRVCEHSVPPECDTEWIANKIFKERKVQSMSHSNDGAATTLIYDPAASSGRPPLVAAAFPFMSFDFAKRSFAIPATREARNMDDTKLLQVTKVYTNGTEASFQETNVSSVLPYTRTTGSTRYRILHNATKELELYFLRGYRHFVSDYSVMERDPGIYVVWYYTLHSIPDNWYVRPIHSTVNRFSNNKSEATSAQRWFSETAYERKLKLQTETRTTFDICWFEGAENKLGVMNYVKAKVRDEGRPLRVLLDGTLSTDVLFLISTGEDVIAITAPYIESPDKYEKLPTPSITVYTSVNSDGHQTRQRITYEGSSFHQVVDNGGGHDVKWFFSSRNWRKILRVTPNNETLYGNELELRNGANLSYTISACAVHTSESWCFGTKVVAIMPDGEVLMQSPSIPVVNVQGRGSVFQDAPDLQVVMLRSRGGCQKLVYKMGVAGENLTGCPGLKWLDWFIENF